MKRLPILLSALLAAVLVRAPARAQTPPDAPSPWTFGAGVGLGVNEPAEAFGDCTAGSTRGALSVRASYTVRPWLQVGVQASGHQEVDTEEFYCLPHYAVPGTQRVYPERVRGSTSYVATEARAVLTPMSSGSIRPLFVAGVGRIWGKELHYPELGVGLELPLGDLRLRFETVGRWLPVPYAAVTYGVNDRRELVERSRVRRTEDHLPVLFRLGVGWRP